jgi:hypothetical protein
MLARRLHNQRLSTPSLPAPAAVVGHLLAVQAQDYLGAKWALAQRTPPDAGHTDADLDEAFARGDFLRTHILRPTWHFVLPADIVWLQALTGPRVQAGNLGMARRLELDPATLKRGLNAMTRALRDGNFLTREELSEVLERARIPAKGQRLAYLVMHAELEALLCSGPRRGKQFTYALLAERAPQARAPLPRAEALAELARRFIQSRGPCTPADLAKWASLTLADTRAAFESVKPQFVTETVAGQTYSFPDVSPPAWGKAPFGLLLSNYDEYVGSYADNRAFGDTDRFNALSASTLYSYLHYLIVNGRLAGLWKRTLLPQSVAIEPLLFDLLTKAQQRALRQAAQPFGAFMGLPATLELA